MIPLTQGRKYGVGLRSSLLNSPQAMARKGHAVLHTDLVTCPRVPSPHSRGRVEEPKIQMPPWSLKARGYNIAHGPGTKPIPCASAICGQEKHSPCSGIRALSRRMQSPAAICSHPGTSAMLPEEEKTDKKEKTLPKPRNLPDSSK